MAINEKFHQVLEELRIACGVNPEVFNNYLNRSTESKLQEAQDLERAER